MKKALAGLLLSASAVAGYAAPVSVEISYLGALKYCDCGEMITDPSAKLEISFKGEDLNNDQVITFDEVSKLVAFGIDFTSPPPPQQEYYITTFQYLSNRDFYISLAHGIYFPNGHFDLAGRFGATETMADWEIDSRGPWDGPWGRWTTDPYVTTVSISSVPEPSAIAMSAIGLGLIGFMARRRQRAASR